MYLALLLLPLTLPAQVVNGIRVPWAMFGTLICFNQYCYCFSVCLFRTWLQLQHAEEGQSVGLFRFVFSFMSQDLALLAARIWKHSGRAGERIMKWSSPRDSTWGRRLVYVFTDLDSVFESIISIHSASYLWITLLHCNHSSPTPHVTGQDDVG